MSYPADEIAELKELCPEVRLCDEGGITYFLLPQLHLPTGCTPAQIDALLCPTPRDGYTSRLFFAQQVASPRGRNWNFNQRILEHNWHAISWQIPAGCLRLAQMVMIHLGAFR